MQFAPSITDALALQIGFFFHFHLSKFKEQNRKEQERGEKTLTLIGSTDKQNQLAEYSLSKT
jgi:hypothetical protein